MKLKDLYSKIAETFRNGYVNRHDKFRYDSPTSKMLLENEGNVLFENFM